MDKSQLLGSQTAKDGFKNEYDVCRKFNCWQNDEESRKWLVIMDYDLNQIESVKAVVIREHKADVNVQVQIKLKKSVDVENIQVKLVSNKTGFNQIDKRWIDSYVSLWNMPKSVTNILKHFTGELLPSIPKPRNRRRMFIDEFSTQDQKLLLDFLKNNRAMIVNDILRGRGKFAAEWVLVAQKVDSNARWILKNINEVINYYDGKVIISPRKSILIGKITVQRKGGDGGRDTAKMLQFKINPLLLFD
jgi:hypothetical protein